MSFNINNGGNRYDRMFQQLRNGSTNKADDAKQEQTQKSGENKEVKPQNENKEVKFPVENNREVVPKTIYAAGPYGNINIKLPANFQQLQNRPQPETPDEPAVPEEPTVPGDPTPEKNEEVAAKVCVYGPGPQTYEVEYTELTEDNVAPESDDTSKEITKDPETKNTDNSGKSTGNETKTESDEAIKLDFVKFKKPSDNNIKIDNRFRQKE